MREASPKLNLDTSEDIQEKWLNEVTAFIKKQKKIENNRPIESYFEKTYPNHSDEKIKKVVTTLYDFLNQITSVDTLQTALAELGIPQKKAFKKFFLSYLKHQNTSYYNDWKRDIGLNTSFKPDPNSKKPVFFQRIQEKFNKTPIFFRYSFWQHFANYHINNLMLNVPFNFWRALDISLMVLGIILGIIFYITLASSFISMIFGFFGLSTTPAMYLIAAICGGIGYTIQFGLAYRATSFYTRRLGMQSVFELIDLDAKKIYEEHKNFLFKGYHSIEEMKADQDCRETFWKTKFEILEQKNREKDHEIKMLKEENKNQGNKIDLIITQLKLNLN